MGLEDFIDDDSNSSSSSSSSTSQSSDSTATDDVSTSLGDIDMQFYGAKNHSTPKNMPMEREDGLSDYKMADVVSQTTGNIEFDSDDIKLYMPVFYLITPNPEYAGGEHYQLKYNSDTPRPSWHNRVVSCVGCYGTRLGSVHKEVAMLAVSQHDKGKAMKEMREKLGDDMNKEQQVYISFFGDMFMLRDLAQANNQFREGDLINRDKIMHHVLSAKTLEARMNSE